MNTSNTKKLLILAVLAMMTIAGAKAQGTVDDYKRAYALQETPKMQFFLSEGALPFLARQA